ncbi:MAG TPA: AI-2E family transporter [Candidatus Binatia bacterium]|nr:AI-2E family transporter [Candidatus Binatia bacterium]
MSKALPTGMKSQSTSRARTGDEPRRASLDGLLDVFGRPFRIHSVALSGLFILAVFYTLYVGREFFLPVTLSFLLSLVLAPFVRSLKRLRIPEPAGAALILLLLLTLAGYGVYRLAGPATAWLQEAPKSLRSIEAKLRQIKKPVAEVSKATQQVEQLASMGEQQKVQKVEIERAGLFDVIFSGTRAFVAQAAVMLILLYFLLASGDLFLRKIVTVLPRFEDKKRAVEISREMEADISTYLITFSLLSIGEGAAIGLAMYFIGMPNPLLWGVMAAALNFIPYVGSLVGMVVLTLVALLSFEDIGRILMVPGVYLIIDITEGYFVTPFVLSKRLTLNPVVLFLWLVFWGWLWGVAGALMAVPLLASLKIVCDHHEALQPVGEVISA